MINKTLTLFLSFLLVFNQAVFAYSYEYKAGNFREEKLSLTTDKGHNNETVQGVVFHTEEDEEIYLEAHNARGLLDDFDEITRNQTGAVGNVSKIVKNSEKQIQKKIKHAKDFGISSNYSTKSVDKFMVVGRHIKSDSFDVIKGTYRGQPVTHYIDQNTGLNVIVKPDGDFLSGWKLSGWKLSDEQLRNVLEHGGL